MAERKTRASGSAAVETLSCDLCTARFDTPRDLEEHRVKAHPIQGMLTRLKSLHGYTIQATDGELGKIDEFYFDDRQWKVRYAIVDVGGWLSGKRVLISAAHLGSADVDRKHFSVDLTRDKMRNSPGIEFDKPLSRQKEKELHTYYGWAPYWTVGLAGIPAVPPPPAFGYEEDKTTAPANPRTTQNHLRSTKEVSGYGILATDREIGHVDDFIADDRNWEIRYLVIDTRKWLPGKKVVLATRWVEAIDWNAKQVRVPFTSDAVKNSPEYHPDKPFARDYETQLHSHYGKSGYWK